MPRTLRRGPRPKGGRDTRGAFALIYTMVSFMPLGPFFWDSGNSGVQTKGGVLEA